MNKVISKKGFTLLEILLVVGIIAILAGIVILAINPTKQLGDTRNAQRRADVLTILNAIYQYSIKNNGTIPDNIDGTGTCELGATKEIDNGTGGLNVDLYTDLVGTEATYLVGIPHDPLATSTDDNEGSGYAVIKDATTNRVTVCAPLAEQDASIYVTR